MHSNHLPTQPWLQGLEFLALLVLHCSASATMHAQEKIRISRFDNLSESIAISQDAKYYAIAVSLHNTIGVYRTKDGQRIAQVDRKLGSSTALAFSPDGKLFAWAVIDMDKKGGQYFAIRMWDLQRNTLFAELKYSGTVLSTIAFAPNGKLLAAGDHDGDVRVWSVLSRKLLFSSDTQVDPVRIAFSPDSKTIASASYDRSLIIMNTRTGKTIKSLAHPESGYGDVQYSQKGDILYSSCVDGKLHTWRLPEYRTRQSIPLAGLFPRLLRIEVMAISPDCNLVASGDGEAIMLSDLQTGKLVTTLQHSKGFEVRHVCFSVSGNLLLSSAVDSSALKSQSEVILWNLKGLQKKAKE